MNEKEKKKISLKYENKTIPAKEIRLIKQFLWKKSQAKLLLPTNKRHPWLWFTLGPSPYPQKCITQYSLIISYSNFLNYHQRKVKVRLQSTYGVNWLECRQKNCNKQPV